MSVRIIVQDISLGPGLDALQNRIKSLRPFYNDLGEILLNSTRDRFSLEVDPQGNKWAPLSQRYAAWKKKNGSSTKILQLRGYLFGSLTYQATDTSLSIGTNRVYASIHQFGGQSFAGQRVGHVRLKAGKRGFAKKKSQYSRLQSYATSYFEVNIPARPFLGLSTSDVASANELLADYLRGE